MDTASIFISHLRRFVAVDLNVLKERWYRQLEGGSQETTRQRAVIEASKIYMEGIKLGMEMLTRLDVDLNEVLREQQREPEQEEKKDTRTDREKKIDGVL